MKKFFTSSRGVVTVAIVCILLGALLASTVPTLNTIGAIIAIIGICIIAGWAFLSGRF